jgi:hypothetical protein
MKIAKHQLIIHESSKETMTNSYRDSFLDCVGVKCISYNTSCISMINAKKVIWFSILSMWRYLMNVIPETCRFYSTKHKPMSLISKVYIYIDYKWFTVFLTKTPSFLHSKLNVIDTSTTRSLVPKEASLECISNSKGVGFRNFVPSAVENETIENK